MKNEERIVERLTESLRGQDRMVMELKGTNQRLDQTVERLDQTIIRLDHLEVKVDKVEGELIKLNIQTVQNTRGIFQIAEKSIRSLTSIAG